MGRILTEMSSLFHFTGRQAGRKLQIVYGNVTSINPAQITEILPSE
jgi:hypothetical protein